LPAADGLDFALVGLFGGVVGNDDAGGGALLFLEALDDHAVMQRTDFHGLALLFKRVVNRQKPERRCRRMVTSERLLALIANEC
jgi:hypothetical protein